MSCQVLSPRCVWLILLSNVSHLCLIVYCSLVYLTPVFLFLLCQIVLLQSSPANLLPGFLVFWSLFRIPTTEFANSLTVPLVSSLISRFRPNLSKISLIKKAPCVFLPHWCPWLLTWCSIDVCFRLYIRWQQYKQSKICFHFIHKLCKGRSAELQFRVPCVFHKKWLQSLCVQETELGWQV